MSKDIIWDSCFQQEIPYEMLNLTNHPTPSDLEKRLGKELVDVFLQTCTPIEKILFGRDKPLKGPEGKKMWIDPSHRIYGERIYITEQSTKTDCLQALTHRGILEIGERVEKMIEEKNRENLDAAVKDAEDVARFEADLRIKFHVDVERERLNEEWQRHVDELEKRHQDEKKDLIKIFEESRKVFCEFYAKKCQEEINKYVEEAIVNTKNQMEEECSRKIDDELAQNHNTLHESMELTLKNLEANDRDRMNELCNQCLNAMDVQCNLMMCRQITELMHLMSIEKCHWQKKLDDLKDENEMTIKMLQNKLNLLMSESFSAEENQSSFIFALWKKFFKSLEYIDVNELNVNENRIFNEFHRIQRDLIENYDDSSRIFVVHDDEQKSPDKKLIDNWIDQKNAGCLSRKDSSVAIEWKRESSKEVIAIEDKFMSSIFHKMSKTDAQLVYDDSIWTKTASSIMKVLKESVMNSDCDEGILKNKINEILRHLFIQQQMISVGDLVPLPNTDKVLIKDSREIIDKRISMAGESVESRQNILAVVDSLELLTHHTSMTCDGNTNLDSSDIEEHQENNVRKCTSLNAKPSYMEVSQRDDCYFLKMTQHEWNQLENLEESLKSKSKRHSSVQFDDTALETPPNVGKRSSILKNSSLSTQRHELNPNENALHPIYAKCQELMKNMRMKSILESLCNDKDICENGKYSSCGGDEK